MSVFTYHDCSILQRKHIAGYLNCKTQIRYTQKEHMPFLRNAETHVDHVTVFRTRSAKRSDQ